MLVRTAPKDAAAAARILQKCWRDKVYSAASTCSTIFDIVAPRQHAGALPSDPPFPTPAASVANPRNNIQVEFARQAWCEGDAEQLLLKAREGEGKGGGEGRSHD